MQLYQLTPPVATASAMERSKYPPQFENAFTIGGNPSTHSRPILTMTGGRPQFLLAISLPDVDIGFLNGCASAQVEMIWF